MGISMTKAEIDELVKRGAVLGPTAKIPATPAEKFVRSVIEPRKTTVDAPVSQPRMQLILHLPGVVVKSEANIRGKARGYMQRKKAIKAAIRDALPYSTPSRWKFGKPPIRVRFTRLSKNPLDDDNLQNAFKWARDVVAEWLQIDDGDKAAAKWVYREEASYVAGIRIEIG